MSNVKMWKYENVKINNRYKEYHFRTCTFSYFHIHTKL